MDQIPLAGAGDLTHRMLALVAQLAIIIFAVRIGGGLMRRFNLPGVLGELMAGIVIGPCLLGGIPLPWIGFPHGIFATAAGGISVSPELYGIASIASVILLFMVGLETDFRQFIKYSVAGTAIGLGGVIVSFAVGDAVCVFFGPDKGMTFLSPACLFLGALCTATSVGITARILSERKRMDSPEGVTILASAIIDDVLGIISLAVIIALIDVLAASNGQFTGLPWTGIAWISFRTLAVCIGFSALGLACSSFIGRFLKSFKNPTTFTTVALALAFLSAAIFESVGLAMIIGAYVMGLSLSRTDITFIIQERLHNVYDFFVPIFFAVMGMLVDIKRLADPKVITFGLIFGVLAVAAKLVGCALPALFLRFNMLGALRIGAGMIPRGEVALIIAGIGMSSNILDADLFGAAIIMTLFTTMLAPPLLAFTLSIPGKGVTVDRESDDFQQSQFPFPSETVADAATQGILETFRAEGFFISMVDSSSWLYQIRKDDLAFSMWRENERTIVLSSNSRDVAFVHTVVYEALVDMNHDLERLKEMAKPQEFRLKLGSACSIRPLPLKEQCCILRPDCVVLPLQSRTKQGAIRELVRRLDGGRLPIKYEEEVFRTIVQREGAQPSELEFGVSMPHVRSDSVQGVMAAVGLCPEGMDFKGIDGEPIKLMVLVVSPKNTSGPHLQFLAGISAALRTQAMVDRVVESRSEEEVVELLLDARQADTIVDKIMSVGAIF